MKERCISSRENILSRGEYFMQRWISYQKMSSISRDEYFSGNEQRIKEGDAICKRGVYIILTLTSMLSTPLPIRTTIRRALNFSKSSLVNCIVCHISAPTASFRTCNSKLMILAKMSTMMTIMMIKSKMPTLTIMMRRRRSGMAGDAPGCSHCSKRINLQKPSCTLHSCSAQCSAQL